ncbi:unnamed protein product [Leptosia nina]|uniref:Uncharacterized protein n=1 Tax=Leptosia nina TaxID=320188 RepID=A0AAV1J0X3_9NEOP
MLACVCQPMETALLFKGGPPVTMGPLGSNKTRHNSTNVMKTLNMLPKSVHGVTDTKDDSASPTSVPSIIDSGNLLNLRKIEREAQSTKILVNPVCTDSFGSDDSPSKSTNSKWKGKKKRLKVKQTKPEKEHKYRDEAREGKTSINCFKIRSHDKRGDDDAKLAKDNCLNENATNLMNQPDLINHPCNSNERLVDESTMTDDELLNRTRADYEKTDLVRRNEVSCTIIFSYTISKININ